MIEDLEEENWNANNNALKLSGGTTTTIGKAKALSVFGFTKYISNIELNHPLSPSKVKKVYHVSSYIYPIIT